MKKIIFFLSVALLSAGVYAQQVNDPNAEPREAKNFHSIKVLHAIDVYLTQGDEESVAVSAGDSKFVNEIKTEVKDGVLRIWHDGGSIKSMNVRKKKLKVYISFKQLDQLDVSDDSHIYEVGDWKDEKLKRDLRHN